MWNLWSRKNQQPRVKMSTLNSDDVIFSLVNMQPDACGCAFDPKAFMCESVNAVRTSVGFPTHCLTVGAIILVECRFAVYQLQYTIPECRG